MLLPIDSEIENEKFTWMLMFSSKLLEKKFKLYVCTNYYFLAKILLVVGTTALFVYFILYHWLTETKNSESLVVDLLIMFLLPIFYWSTFDFSWSKRHDAYIKMFMTAFILGSIVYSLTTDSNHELLGILSLQFLTLHFSLQLAGFMILAFCITAGYAAS